VTDTTFRDAHQSLLATRVRSKDLVAVAGHVPLTTPQLLSIECWGGATYDVALRFLHEDPWARLAALREAVPNVCLQMLLRGRNTVGYTPYPEQVTDSFIREATATGVDIFRIFDALNDVAQMRPAIDAVRETGTAIAEVALCYTGDLADPGEDLYTLDYYLRLAERIVDAGAHVLAIKDMAGLPAPTGRVYTHEIPGGQLSNLRQQAITLGLGQRFEEVENAYAAADRLLGRLVKVTPSSKVVGDLALQLVGSGVRVEDFAADPGKYDLPDSVIGFLRGELGDPPGGWPEPFRSRALEGRREAQPPAELSTADLAALAESPRDTLNRLLFPAPTRECTAHREQYGDVSVLPTKEFLYGLRAGVEHAVDLEPGVTLLMGVEAVSDADQRGMRTVMCTLNGQLRPASIRDRSIEAAVKAAEKADRSNPRQVTAPFACVVTSRSPREMRSELVSPWPLSRR
jgi:pyruvate carboxylase